MAMATILVKRHEPFILTFVASSKGCSTWSLALIGQAVSEIFEIVDDDGRTLEHGNHISSSYELSAQVS